jgi:hypothetical protein
VSRPSPDEIEITVFGPGYGESILVHLGDGEWIVVDSCLDRDRPVVLDYLADIGVDASSSIRFVVATHWHDDHVRGIARVFCAARTSKFVCSTALRDQEFLALLELFGDMPLTHAQGLREMRGVVAEVRSRGKQALVWAGANRRIHFRGTPAAPERNCEVFSLSPTDAGILRSKAHFAELLPVARRPKRALPDVGPNHAAVAMWIRVGSRILLLGSDLEETSGLRCWSDVVASSGRPRDPAAVIKIPHHGSETGEHPGIWSELCSPRPIGIATPFIRGRVALPTNADVARACARTSDLYLSSPPVERRSRSRSGAVAKTVDAVTRRFRDASGPMGWVRLRAPISNPAAPWTRDLFGAAHRVDCA